MKNLFLAAVMALAAITAPFAQMMEDRVVAIVNEQIITESAVNARTALLMRQLNLPNATPAQREALSRRTLGTLIDEELQRQYAQQLDITVSEQEVAEAKRNLIAQNPGFTALVAGLEETANEKLYAEMRWAKIAGAVAGSRVQVNNAEIDQLIADMTKSRHVIEREIAQIMLNVDETNEVSARARMEEVLQQLQQGADFATLARTTSEDTVSAAQGGVMGWFAPGELNPQLEEALAKMKPGDISGLIRTPLGVHVLKLTNVRTTKPVETDPIEEKNLILVARPLAEGEDQKDARDQFTANVIKKFRNTDAVRQALADETFKTTYSASAQLGWMNPANLQSALQQVAANAKPGQWSAPFLADGNVGALYLAGTRQTVSPQLTAYRERVRKHLTDNRLELETRRLQRELRQRAFVDIRW